MPLGVRLPLGRLAAVFGVVAVLLTLRGWQALPDGWIGGFPDPPLHMWFLGWTQHVLGHGGSPFTTDRLNPPDGVNLMWNTLMPLPGLLLSPVTALLGPLVAYDVLDTASIALSMLAGCLACARFVRRAPAAVAGGVLYGLSPYVVTHATNHPSLSLAVTPPLLVLLYDDLLRRRVRSPLRTGALIGVVVAVQVLIHEEVAATEVLATLVLFAVLATLHPARVRSATRDVALAAAGAGAVVLAICAWPLAVQVFSGGRPPGRLQPPDYYVIDLANLVVPSQTVALAPASAISLTERFTGNSSEWTGYLGVPLLVLLGLAAVRLRRHVAVTPALLTGAVMLLLAMGPQVHAGGVRTGIPLPWRAVEPLPGFNDIAPARLTGYVDLAVALLVAIALDGLVTTRTLRRPVLALAALSALSLAPASIGATAGATPAFFTAGARALPDGAVTLVVPVPTPCVPYAMLWQAQAGMRFRMIGGYHTAWRNEQDLGTTASILDGMAFLHLAPPADDVAVPAIRRELSRWRVTAVVVGPMAMHDDAVRLLTAVLGRPPVRDAGVDVWSGVSIPPAPPGPQPAVPASCG